MPFRIVETTTGEGTRGKKLVTKLIIHKGE
jgi:hypothetical protein